MSFEGDGIKAGVDCVLLFRQARVEANSVKLTFAFKGKNLPSFFPPPCAALPFLALHLALPFWRLSVERWSSLGQSCFCMRMKSPWHDQGCWSLTTANVGHGFAASPFASLAVKQWCTHGHESAGQTGSKSSSKMGLLQQLSEEKNCLGGAAIQLEWSPAARPLAEHMSLITAWAAMPMLN